MTLRTVEYEDGMLMLTFRTWWDEGSVLRPQGHGTFSEYPCDVWEAECIGGYYGNLQLNRDQIEQAIGLDEIIRLEGLEADELTEKYGVAA